VFAAESADWAISTLVLAGLLAFLTVSAAIRTMRLPSGKDIFNPVYLFLALYTVQYVIEPIDFLLNGPRHLPRGSYYVNLGFLYTILGLIAFLFGYHGSLGSKIAAKLPRLSSLWSGRRTIMVVSVLYLVGIIAFMYLIRVTGGSGVSGLLAIALVRREFLFGRMWIVAAMRTMVVGSLVLFAFFVRGKRANSRGLLLSVILVCLLPLLPLFFVGGRYDMLLLMLGLLIIRHYLSKPIHLWQALIVGAILAGGAVWYGIIRGGAISFHEFMESASWSSYLHEVAARFQGYELFLVMLEEMPRTLDFQWGRTIFIDPLVLLVPRVLWPGKPIALGNEVFQVAFMPDVFAYSNPGLTIIAELYGNFSVPGIIMGMWLYGVFWKTLYSFLRLHDFSKSQGIVVAYVLTLFTLFDSISGGISSLMVDAFMYLLPLVLILKFIGRPALNYGANGRFLFQRLS